LGKKSHTNEQPMRKTLFFVASLLGAVVGENSTAPHGSLRSLQQLPQLPFDPVLALSSQVGIGPSSERLFPTMLDPLNVGNRAASCKPIMKSGGKKHGIDNGQVSYSRKPCGRGSTAFFSCNTGCGFVGYDPSVSALSASCDIDSQGMINWMFPNKKQPSCDYVRCDDIRATVEKGGGRVTYSNKRVIGSTATVNCNTGCGFSGGGQLSGLVLQCLPSKFGTGVQWTTPDNKPLPNPICQFLTCPSITPIPNGKISYSGGLSPAGVPLVGSQAILRCTTSLTTVITSCYTDLQGQIVWSPYTWTC